MRVYYPLVIPRSTNGTNVEAASRFHECPDCGAKAWFSPREDLFYCRTDGCYFVADPDEFAVLVKDRYDDHHMTVSRRRAVSKAEEDAYQNRQASLHIGVVYYLQFGDRIKIGTTTNIGSRMHSVPWEQILLMEPGSYEVEKKRHKQFRASHVTLEWFAPSADLMDFIDERRAELHEFNLERFPDQGPFPWARETTSLSTMRSGNLDVLSQVKWDRAYL